MSDQLTEYKKIFGQYKKLQKSSYKNKEFNTGGQVVPTYKDVKRSKELRAINEKQKKLLSKYKGVQWYDTKDEQKRMDEAWAKKTADERLNENWFQKGLAAVSTPLYITTGVAESALGKGSKPGLFANIESNIKQRETFGDLIRKYGAHGWTASGVGLMLDVAFDPVNWATMGTSAFIPKLGVGLAKGGLEGLSAGFKAGVAEKALTLSKAAEMTPLFKKGLSEGVAAWSMAKTAAFDKTIGEDVIRNVGNKSLLPKTADYVTSKMASFLPENFRRAFRYDPLKSLDTALGLDVKRANDGIPVVKTMDDFYRVTNVKPNPLIDSFHNNSPLTRAGIGMIEDEALTATKRFSTDRARTLFEPPEIRNARMESDAKLLVNLKKISNDVKDLVDKSNDIGIKWADNIRNFMKNVTVNHKTLDEHLDGYRMVMGVFRKLKVTLSPSAWVNSVIGNAVMTKMSGIKLRLSLLNEIKNAHIMVKGGNVDLEFLKKLSINPVVGKWMQEHPLTFTKAFGVNPAVFKQSAKFQELLDEIPKTVEGLKARASVEKAFARSANEVRMMMNPVTASGMAADELNNLKKINIAGAAYLDKNGIPPGAFINTYSADLFAGAYRAEKKLSDTLEKLAKENPYIGPLAKKYQQITKWGMSNYEAVDQSYKIGLFVHLTNNGIDRSELKIIKNFIPLTSKDVIKVAGRDLYTLTPEIAAKFTQEVYMNYGAMPSVVKLMRGLPFLGQPFIAFSYAMMTKIGRTAKYNAALFSKMNSFVHEVGGGKSPSERAALAERRNAYLNDLGMMKLPFGNKNPLYFRVEQLVPYMSLSMFNSGKRDLQVQGLTKNAIDLSDKLFFGTPEGQTLFNYVVLPMILRDGIEPKGQFGQRLYPKNATSGEKLAYALRDTTEGYFSNPVVGGTAGAVTGAIPGGIPDNIQEFVPLGYRYRQTSRALHGETSVGVIGKEDPVSRSVRAYMGLIGLPVYKLKINDKTLKAPKP